MQRRLEEGLSRQGGGARKARQDLRVELDKPSEAPTCPGHHAHPRLPSPRIPSLFAPGRRASSPCGCRPGLSVLQPLPLGESRLSLPTPGPSGPQGNPGSLQGLPGSASQGPGARTGLHEIDFCSSSSQDEWREGGLAEREGRLWSFRISPNCVKKAEGWACAHQAV